jgi:glyoxylase I family protein
MTPPDEAEREKLAQRRAELAARYVKPLEQRAPSNARGIHHAAFVCRDVEETITFYDGLLGFPLVELVENRDYPGSSHFFFDLGNSTLLGFFDFPGLGLEEYQERIGSVQHIAIAVPPDKHAMLQAKLDDHEIPYDGPQRGIPESLYLRDPNGIGIELLSDELMYFAGKYLDRG